MLSGVAVFYLNAVVHALFTSSVINLRSSASRNEVGSSWSMCGDNLPLNNSYCEEFAVKMNLALDQLSWSGSTMKRNVMTNSGQRAIFGGFNPPDPDEVQKEIDDLKQEIEDLQEQLAQIDKNDDIDKFETEMAIVQTEIAQLTIKMDNLIQQAQDTFKDEIEVLMSSLNAVIVITYNLKITVADLERELEYEKIIDIMHDIVNGATPGTAYLFQHGSFKSSMTTVMSSIVSLSYAEVLKDNSFILKIFKFLNLLEERYKLDGCKHLYYNVLLNNHLYNRPQPFLVARMLHTLLQSDDPSVVVSASSFLKSIIHPIVRAIATDKMVDNISEFTMCSLGCEDYQRWGNPNPTWCSTNDCWSCPAPPPNCTIVAADEGFTFPFERYMRYYSRNSEISLYAYQFLNDYDDSFWINDHCAAAKSIGDASYTAHCYSLQPGNRLSNRKRRGFDGGGPVDFDNADRYPCPACSDTKCYKITEAQTLPNTAFWTIYGDDMLCQTDYDCCAG